MSGLVSLATLMDKTLIAHKRKGLPPEIALIRSVLSQLEDTPYVLSSEEAYSLIQQIAKNAKYDKSVLRNDVLIPFFYHLLANSTLPELCTLLDSKLFEKCLCTISKHLYQKSAPNSLIHAMQELLRVNESAYVKLRELCFAAKLPLNNRIHQRLLQTA